jgi:glycosyltransferase involved in cell wall biosynthesis
MKLLVTTQAVDRDDPVLGFFHGWLLEFAKHFERIDVICLRKGVYSLPPHVHVHSLGKEEGVNRIKYVARFYYYFSKVFFLYRPDYVFYHMGAVYNVLGAPFFLLRKWSNTKFYWWKTHGKVKALKETLALTFIDKVFTASFDRKTDKVVVVGHAIDTERFTSRDTAVHTPSACLMVGRIVPIKKIEVALRAFARIANQTSLSLRLVGSPDNTKYEETLKQYCGEHALTMVHFLGSRKQTEMPALYDDAGILLHPAYEAGFDKAVLEAMATGVIPLTSIPSFEPILSPYNLFIPPEDDGGYADAMLRIIKMSDDERKTLRDTLRTIVVSGHSVTTIPHRIFDV